MAIDACAWSRTDADRRWMAPGLVDTDSESAAIQLEASSTPEDNSSATISHSYSAVVRCQWLRTRVAVACEVSLTTGLCRCLHWVVASIFVACNTPTSSVRHSLITNYNADL